MWVMRVGTRVTFVLLLALTPAVATYTYWSVQRSTRTYITDLKSLARERGLILHTTVGIGYETPWRQVEAMLVMAAERTTGLLREPVPFVLQQSLGDYAVTYQLNVFCDKPGEMFGLYTELHRNVLDVFNAYNVQIMTPSYIGDPAQPKVVPRKEWFAKPAEEQKPSDEDVSIHNRRT